MRKNILSAIALGLVLAAGSASAADETDATDLILNVESTCAWSVSADLFESTVGANPDTGDGFISMSSNGLHNGSINVACSAGIPYTIQTDAAVGGSVAMTGDNLGQSIPAGVYQGAQFSGVPFGTLANGEHYAATTNGEFQTIPFNVAMNSANGGNDFLPLPVADTYRGRINWTFSY